MNIYTIHIHTGTEPCVLFIEANFESPVTTGDFIEVEFNGKDEELEVYQVVHKVGGKSCLHVNVHAEEMGVAA